MPDPVPGIARRVVLCRDDDARHGPADQRLRRVASAWRAAGIDAAVATPWPVRRDDKSDLADVIREHGPEAVRARIAAALGSTVAGVRRVPVEDARGQVEAAVGAFFSEQNIGVVLFTAGGLNLRLPPPPFTHGARVDTGVGKSTAALRQAARSLPEMRARGDGRCIVLAVPRHDLGDDLADYFMGLPAARAAGLVARVWRGRGADDPSHLNYSNPDVPRRDKARMCGDIERMNDAVEAGLSVQHSVCRTEIDAETYTCPMFYACSYQRQFTREADVWIVTHEMLFRRKPDNFGEVAALIVDETVFQKGLIGDDGPHLTVSLDALAQDIGNGRLMDLRRQFLDVLRDLPDGPVRRDAFNGSLLTGDSIAEAIKLEWSRLLNLLHPGQPRDTRQALAKPAAARNRTVKRLLMAWRALAALTAPDGPEASGWLALATEDTDNGPVRVLRVKGRERIADGWQVPTLILDALLPVELVRHYWPDIELVADVRAAAPHQRVYQVTDRTYGKSMFEPLTDDDAKADPKRAARRANRLADLRAIVIREACRAAPGKVLVVLQKSVEAALHALGCLPSNVDTAHHNAVAGRDDWRDVAVLIVVGRTQPSPGAVERIAEALTGRAVAAPLKDYQRGDASREMSEGTTSAAAADRHADEVAELVRWQVAEGELVQIVGRARGVNRSASDPVYVLVLTDLPLPLPLAGVLGSKDVEPTWHDHMIALGGVAFESARHAAVAYPQLWPNHEAAKKALQRERCGTFPGKSIFTRECPAPPRLAYQLAGAGQKPAAASYYPALCLDPVAFLTARLGRLAWPCVEPDSPPPGHRLDAPAAELSHPEPAAEPVAPAAAEPAAPDPAPGGEAAEAQAMAADAGELPPSALGDGHAGRHRRGAVSRAVQYVSAAAKIKQRVARHSR